MRHDSLIYLFVFMDKKNFTQPKSNLFSVLRPYGRIIVGLIVLTIAGNTLSLAVPKIIAGAIDAYTHGNFVLERTLIYFFLVAFGIFVFTYAQTAVQTYAAELVARDLRSKAVAALSLQEYSYLQTVGPAKLLTNLTSDIDAVKNFVAQAVSSIVSSLFLIVGASILLLAINWRLGLLVLLVIPAISITFYFVFSKVRQLFKKSQESIDALNRVINESILGAALIRLFNSEKNEYAKFLAANTASRDIGFGILRLFSLLIPVIILSTNLATLSIVVLGGHYVIMGSLTMGDFTAFTSYLTILIFPILIIGFMSSVIAQATASYQRVAEVLEAPPTKRQGTISRTLRGQVEFKNISLTYGERPVLNDISFVLKPGTRNAIIGPTAAGKTQLVYLLAGLLQPTSGSIEIDGVPLMEYDPASFYQQIVLVFQDNVIFNATVRENIAFSTAVEESALDKAIKAAEVADFVEQMPQKMETVISERGTSLSGGQKQRIMLARALALNPQILLLDDFTARVDALTERKILDNIRDLYPHLTLLSVTQQIASVKDYDQILVVMEGELIAVGRHEELLETSPEYVQIFNSQQSTTTYEVLPQ